MDGQADLDAVIARVHLNLFVFGPHRSGCSSRSSSDGKPMPAELSELEKHAFERFHPPLRGNVVFSSNRWMLYAVFLGWFAILSAEKCVAQPPPPAPSIDWRTGKDFDKFSRSPISVSWQHAPLGDHLAKFANSQRLSIVLDRRIDPNLLLDLTVNNVSIEQFMLRLAQASGTKFCRFGDCYYFGPDENVERLLAVDALVSNLQQSKGALFSRSAAVECAELTTPRALLRRWAEANKFEIANIDLVEHDLMRELNLPPMRLDLRLALLLSQFDLWFRQSKTAALITIIPPPEKLTATIRLNGYDVDAQLLDRIRTSAPGCKVSKSKRSIVIAGPSEALESARNVVIESFTPPPRSIDEKRFQLTVENKRGLILNAVAEQLGLKVIVPEDCAAVLEKVVSVTVKDATVEVLLHALFQNSDCTYSLDATTLRLFHR